jgi:peptidoglycan/xylan/chitin deacetylase (PgdA/CDA1 family)
MSGPVRVDTTTIAGWSDLVDEFDRWGEAGATAILWWRDDDAVAATPRLDDLLRLAGEVPLALAVIPALARPDLGAALAGAPLVAVLQHGWQHANRAGNGKKSEYPKGRSAAVVGEEIGAGQARLKALFGTRALPLFVPPWNRIADELLPALPANGIAGLSRMAARRCVPAPAGLAAIDVHVDLVAWGTDRGFIGVAAALGGLVDQLRASRCGAAAAARPVGILTHHLIMDGATAAFLGRLIELTGSHTAARWARAGELMQ